MYTLKSDHGKFACAEDGGHAPGTIDGRAYGLMTATRDSAGAWESFTIEPSDTEEQFGIKSVNGFYACCEDEGRAGYIAFNRESIGPWEKFILYLDGPKVSFESVCRPGYFIKVYPDGTVKLEQPMWEGSPSNEPGGYETFTADPPISFFKSIPSSIQGQLRVDEAGYVDDSGNRVLPIGLHLGDLFSVFIRDVSKAESLIELAQRAGYPLIHFWMNLGTLGGTYWQGRECGPGYTPDFWEQLRQFSDLLDSYGIKGGYNLGDYALWPGQNHKDVFRELGRFTRGRTNKTAAYVFGGNEAWQTGADSKEEISDALACFKEEDHETLVTTTAPPTEEVNDIAAWCGGDFYAIHGYRDAEDHDRIRHIFSVPWEGDPPDKYGWQDEPTGPGDGVSVKASHCYSGRDVDSNHMCALAVQSLMCNQGFNYFCEAGVKSDTPVESYAGFYEVAQVHRIVPIDIMGWPGVFHFGGSQSGHRVFSPLADDTLRFDHRISHSGEIFGIFYGDEGHTRAKCERACFLSFVGFDGTVSPEMQFDLSQEIAFDFRRSSGGQPNGYTAQVIRGRLR